MNLKTLFGSTTLLGAAMLATACGGGLDVDQVREDFDNPSGSVSDESAVIAVNEKRTVGDDSVDLAGNFNPFGGFGLTARLDTASPLRSLDARRLLQPAFRSVFGKILGTSTLRFGLTDQQIAESGSDLSACVDEEELARQVSGSVGADGGSGSFSLSVDLNSCTTIMTGTIEIAGEFEFTQEKLYLQLEEAFGEVCEKVTDRASCVDGTIIMEMNGTIQGQLDSLMAWDLKSSWNENGTAESAASKGGLRVAGTDGAGGSVELLVYVRNSDGDEVSYVLKVSADGQGNGVLEVKGKDGSLTCTVSADGSGSCTGTANYDWTADDALLIRQDDRFRFYE